MKTSLIVVSLILFRIVSFSQTCNECPHPRVAFYDGDVQVSLPASADSAANWYNLFWAAASANEYMNTIDPTTDCLYKLDRSFIKTSDLQKSGLSFGPEQASLAPIGSTYSTDYLIHSTVTGSQGNFSFSLTLETGPTRELVKSVSFPFTPNLESAKAAGLKAATAVSPLLDIIREFEINKRNTDPDISVRYYWKQGSPDEITVTPEKAVLDTGEIIKVNIKMLDCDGVPLGNRKITFKDFSMLVNDSKMPLPFEGTRGGVIIPEEASTDEAGNATVEFKAGRIAGPGKIMAYYPHHAPCGKSALMQGTAMVQIKAPPPKFWLLKADMMKIYTLNSDTVKIFDLGGHSITDEYSAIVDLQTKGKLTAVIENLAEDPVNDFSYSTDAVEPLILMVSGEGFMDEYGQYRETVDGDLTSANIRSDNVSGAAGSGADIQFDYSKDSKYFGISVGIRAVGSYHGRMYGPHGNLNEWWDYGGDYDGYYLSAGGGGDPRDTTNHQLCWIDKTPTGYSAFWSIYNKELKSSFDGTQRITTKAYVKVTLDPYNPGELADVERNQLFPDEFILKQNVPNPFRSATSISFQIHKREPVSLRILNSFGETVAILAKGDYPQGTYTFSWNAENLPEGIYFCRMQAGPVLETRKMILLK